MPRRNNNRRSGAPSPVGLNGPRAESGPGGHGDERYLVRQIPGTRAVKTYRCPGCDHEIQTGVAHVVAWPADGLGGAEDRRHWHTGCWNGRGSRGITRRWS
ncbi:ATP/GTP-binding protein [Rhodococcus sp. NPDC058505]|uniref:ATP/GTP-binding protein n=1 Tax=unclassified Rhodococcus (in: high G+C Gram-positive bacteria) TaxID=192944 RepID=UPI003669CF6C